MTGAVQAESPVRAEFWGGPRDGEIRALPAPAPAQIEVTDCTNLIEVVRSAAPVKLEVVGWYELEGGTTSWATGVKYLWCGA